MKTLIAIPCFDMVHADFMDSFVKLQKTPDSAFTMVKNTMIYIARDIIAANAIQAGFERVLWLDSDMVLPADALLKLSADMDQGMHLVSGLYFTRKPPVKPVAYSDLWWKQTENGIDTGAENLWEYKEGLNEIAACGFGCCLTSVDLLKRVGDRFGSPFMPIDGMGEDMAFCMRVKELGEKMFVDTSVKCGHVGQETYNETYYIRQGKRVSE